MKEMKEMKKMKKIEEMKEMKKKKEMEKMREMAEIKEMKEQRRRHLGHADRQQGICCPHLGAAPRIPKAPPAPPPARSAPLVGTVAPSVLCGPPRQPSRAVAPSGNRSRVFR